MVVIWKEAKFNPRIPQKNPVSVIPLAKPQQHRYDPLKMSSQLPLTRKHLMSAPLQITIKLFAIYQETYGTEVLHWQVAPGSTVMDVFQRILSEHPSLAEWQAVTRFGVNLEFVSPETVLQEGDEVVLIPPVSGG
ncbi:MoaD/ThiS family protein [Synechococcus sp. BDU 130192]|uniref:MoaD/ThiS family protein n=1 Tax=Synechococcus sp. BDU 130192 TaxID=2042059 RepID=UPI0030D825BD